MNTKNCRHCGIVFKLTEVTYRGGKVGKHNRQVYCSTTCARAALYANNALDPAWRLNKLCHMAKHRAKEKDVPFNISAEYLNNLWEIQEGRCAVSGRAFVLEAGSGRVHPDTVSVDRIVPELGYVTGNVRLVTYHVNVCLSEFGYSALVELLKNIQKKGHAT